MKSLIFILVLTIGVTKGTAFFTHCDVHKCDSLMPQEVVYAFMGMPPNEEELETVCPPLYKVMDCVADLVVECTGQTIDELVTSDNETIFQLANFLSNLFKLNYDICNVETQIHKNYVQSVPCFRDMIRNPDASCREEASKLYEAYRMAIDSDKEEPLEEIMSEAHCMTLAYSMACNLMKVQKNCGELAKDTFSEIVKRIQFLKLGTCNQRDLLTLKTKFLDFLEEQGEERDFLASAFNLRRKK